MILPSELQKNKKYYMIWCNTFHEVKLKDTTTLYGNKQYIFSSRLGDLYMSTSSDTEWSRPHPYIFDDRFQAVLEIGLKMFRGGYVKRAPYNQEKHIDICFKYIPERMI